MNLPRCVLTLRIRTFDKVIWTDESSIKLVRHSQIMRVKIGKEWILKPAPKHAVKVHVWAGISKSRATPICVFDQIMDEILYTQILEKHLLVCENVTSKVYQIY